MTETPLQAGRNLTAVTAWQGSRLDSPAPSPLVCGKDLCGGHGGEMPGTVAPEIHLAAVAASRLGR